LPKVTLNPAGFSSRWFARVPGNLWVLHNALDNNLYDFLMDASFQSFEAVGTEDSSSQLHHHGFIMELPFMRITGLASPEDIEYILKTKFDNYVKGPHFSGAATDVLGHGIFAVDGPAWKKQRKTASHEFTVDKFKHFYLDSFVDNIAKAFKLIDLKPAGTSLDVQDLFAKYTLESIGHLGFGVRLGCLDSEEPVPFAVAFDNAQHQLWRRIAVDQVWWKALKFLNIGREAEMKRQPDEPLI